MFVQSLDGAWELCRPGSKEVFEARVPGCVHLDLMRAGAIEDPFVGDNEYRCAWVHETDWEYSRSFEADADLAGADRVYLECDGLDTIADLTLNGHILGRVDNMYIRQRFDVTDKLTPTENTLRIKFASPVNYVKPLVEKEPLMSPGDSIPGSIYTRKSPCQWGWDWGPKIPTSGIWRSIRLAAYKIGRIDDVHIRQSHRHSGQVTLSVEVNVEKFRRTACGATVTLTHPDGKVEAQVIKSISSTGKCSFVIAKPKLWWPNGYGDQPLYNIETVLKSNTPLGGDMLSPPEDALTRRIGLRTISIDQSKDKHGKAFAFVVNGVPIFAKGANWIPADQFPCRISDDHYRHLVWSAARANMNMLRVWGGGIYEDERFYDLCDEYGILIWQDFMYSCAHYPVDKGYLENCRKDAEYNVIRLRNRACLALWCGNNEMEWFLCMGVGGDKNEHWRKMYAKIFHDLLPSVCSKLDPDTHYWPSSPSNGMQKPFHDPNGEAAGDCHYWDVWHARKPFTAYREIHPSFMSEFGLQSLPALETVKSFAVNGDLNMTSYVMECHQKSGAGNALILHYLAQTFRFPRNFEMMCCVTQLVNAEAMRCGVEHWRRNRGRCMGTLYWQINDCYPVISGASLDYFGRWKALHYAAKRFYSPILLSVAEKDTSAEIHVTNDTVKPAKIEVKWSLENLDGTVLRKSKIKTKIDGEQNRLVAGLDFAEELAGDTIRQAVLVTELVVNGRPAGLTMTSFVPPKHLDLKHAKIKVETNRDDDGAYLEISSHITARWVCLSIPKRDVIFSDNYFDLPAGRTVTVRIESEIDDAALAKVKAYSLRDSY